LADFQTYRISINHGALPRFGRDFGGRRPRAVQVFGGRGPVGAPAPDGARRRLAEGHGSGVASVVGQGILRPQHGGGGVAQAFQRENAGPLAGRGRRRQPQGTVAVLLRRRRQADQVARGWQRQQGQRRPLAVPAPGLLRGTLPAAVRPDPHQVRRDCRRRPSFLSPPPCAVLIMSLLSPPLFPPPCAVRKTTWPTFARNSRRPSCTFSTRGCKRAATSRGGSPASRACCRRPAYSGSARAPRRRDARPSFLIYFFPVHRVLPSCRTFPYICLRKKYIPPTQKPLVEPAPLPPTRPTSTTLSSVAGLC